MKLSLIQCNQLDQIGPIIRSDNVKYDKTTGSFYSILSHLLKVTNQNGYFGKIVLIRSTNAYQLVKGHLKCRAIAI